MGSGAGASRSPLASFSAPSERRPAETSAAVTVSRTLKRATKAGVDRVLETARRAGAEDVRGAQEREWGGYTGYFTDPDGFRWEIAYNPGEIGQAVLP